MFSAISHFAWLMIQAFVGFSILLPIMFYLAYRIQKLIKKQPPAGEELHEEKDYAIIVSVYGRADTWQPLLHSLQQLNYTNYLVYVVVNDNMITNLHFDNNRIIVLHTAKVFDNAVRLHRFTIENFKRPHTHVAILDGNSLVDKEYLNNLNICFHEGYQAVQSRTDIRNSSGIYDMIQTAGTIYSNLFTGELSFAVGSSAMLSGTGSAFTVRLYKYCLQRIKITDTNFIKTAQKIIINRGYQVAFAHYAVVYDDKAVYRNQLMQQHARTINTWLNQFAGYCRVMGKGIALGNINQLVSGILCIQLPLFTNLIAAVFCLFINVWMNPATAMIWAGCLLLFPLYILMATVHAANYIDAEQILAADADKSSFFPAISMYEEDDDYDIAMQTM